MAEVKSYKCDMCGKVYHRDENDKSWMRIVYNPTDDEVKRFDYEHICPECERTIGSVIHDPDIIKNYKESLKDAEKNLSGFKRLFTKIHDKLYPLLSMHSLWTSVNDPDYYEERVVDPIINKCDTLETSRDRWKRAAICLIGAVVGLLISAFI
jgi:hypothetical protein